MLFAGHTNLSVPNNPVLVASAYWHHLANNVEPSMCGGDAAYCQITFTTCYYYCGHICELECNMLSY